VRMGAEQGFELAPGVVLHGRGGMFFETSPLPSEIPGSSAFDIPSKSTISVPTSYFDTSRIAFTTGAGLTLGGPHRPTLPPLDLDVYAQYHVLLARTITSTDPNGGGGNISQAEASGHIKVFGMTAGVKF
jgi:hypothetical protein